MNPVFTEIQRFKRWWHYLIAGSPVIIFSTMFFLIQYDLVQTKNNQKEPLFFILLILFLILFFIWFYLLKLKTHINQNSIYVHFYGIPFAKRTIQWNEIQSISIINYSPLTDYGGWGVRYSASVNGWCYNVSGNYGIKLIQKNGKSFLIGTQKKDEAEKIINTYFKK